MSGRLALTSLPASPGIFACSSEQSGQHCGRRCSGGRRRRVKTVLGEAEGAVVDEAKELIGLGDDEN